MARFSQGLIGALTNPSFGRDLFQVGRETGQTLAGQPRMIEENAEKRRAVEAMAFDQSQEALAAAQSGNIDVLTTKIANMTKAAAAAPDSRTQAKLQAEIQKLQEMVPAAKQTAKANQVTAVSRLDAALKQENLPPQARASIIANRERLLSDPDVSSAYSSAVANTFLENEKLREAQETQQATEAYGLMVAGVEPEKLKGRVGIGAWGKAKTEYSKYLEGQRKAREMAQENTPLTKEDLDFMPEAEREAIIRTQKVNGIKAARTRASKYIDADAKRSTEQRVQLTEDATAATTTEAALNYLSGETSTNWSGAEDLQEAYASAETEEKEAMLKDAEEFFSLGIRAGQEGNVEDVGAYATAYVDNMMAKKYGLDSNKSPVSSPEKVIGTSGQRPQSAAQALAEWLANQ